MDTADFDALRGVYEDVLRLLGHYKGECDSVMHGLIRDTASIARKNGLSPQESKDMFCSLSGVTPYAPTFAEFTLSLYKPTDGIERREYIDGLLAESAGLSVLPSHSGLPRGRVAYFRNIHTDEAYGLFSAYSPSLAAAYHPTFVAACEEVASGNTEYCILPQFNSTDGDMISLYRLAERYDLKTVARCNVSSDDDTTVSYALLGRNFNDPEDAPIFDFSFIPEPDHRVDLFLSSLEYLGAKLIRITSYPSGSLAHYLKYRITLDVSSVDIGVLLTYLTLSIPNYIPLGFYKLIN